ncbi:MAG: diaminobutyrate acetyltransferase [Hyphomonadaceae bacterium]
MPLPSVSSSPPAAHRAPVTDKSEPGHPIRPVVTRPRAEDAVAVHDLIAACPPLDPNSLYANLLQCSHFAETCALVRDEAGAAAWISGYRLPQAPEAFFVWQVAVREDMRGRSMAKVLLDDLLARPALKGVTTLHTTITPDNDASWGMFRSIAKHLSAEMSDQDFFDRRAHFGGRHDSERLVIIGPFGGRPPPGAA